MAKTILVVDDEEDFLKTVKFRLKKSGYNVLTAVDGEEALSSARANRPDLILLDLRLPLISGYDVCRQIKADKKLKHIPVILFTASVSQEITEKVKEIHAEDFVLKPFEPVDLLRKIRKFIG